MVEYLALNQKVVGPNPTTTFLETEHSSGNTNRLGDESGLLNRRAASEPSGLGGSTPSVSAGSNEPDNIVRFPGKIPISVAEHCKEIAAKQLESERSEPC